MSSYYLRAITKKGDKTFDFKFTDGICPIDQNLFILMGIKGSPILRLDSIYLGNEDGTLFEHDLIITKDTTYEAVYVAGGFILKSPYSTETLMTIGDYQVIESNLLSSEDIESSKKQQVKYNDSILPITQFKGLKHKKVIANNFGWELLDSDKIQQSTLTLSPDNELLYFGDKIDGETVIMYKGRICLTDGENIREYLKIK